MRIGLITGEYPPDRGGVGDFTAQLSGALTDLGHQVHIITSVAKLADPDLGGRETAACEDEPTVHRAIAAWRLGCWGQILKLCQDLQLEAMNIQYQAAAYDMHPGVNLVPRRQRRPPVVVTFHDLKVPYLFPKAGPLRWLAVRLLAQRADGVIVTNREDKLRLSKLRPRIANLTRIPIGSNIPFDLSPGYDREAERARWDIEPDDLVLGYFGFLNESKGGETLIQALGLLVEQDVPAHLLKIGGRVGTSDPTNRAYADRVDDLIASLDLKERVHWTGYVDTEQVSACLRATDVCVLPYRDGVSFRRGSLIACLTHGRAIVTTRPALPLPDIEDGKTMLLVEPGSPPALAEAVRQLWLDSALQSRLEMGAESLATEFTWDRIARRTTALFARLTAGCQ